MLWEWITATVQAIRWHVAVERRNRGGPVAAISLSQQCACIAQHAWQQSPSLQFGVIPVCSLPHPTPDASLSAFVLQLHIPVKSISMGVGAGGCMG